MNHPRESKNSARRVRAAENKVKCLRMIVAGVSRADIAKQLGVTKKTICIYVQQSMAELNEERLQLATQVYDLEQERLEALLRAVYIKGTDPKNVSLNHWDRVFAVTQRLTAVAEKRIAATKGTAGIESLSPEEADRIAGLVMQEATDEERVAIREGDSAVFATVVARVKTTP